MEGMVGGKVWGKVWGKLILGEKGLYLGDADKRGKESLLTHEIHFGRLAHYVGYH
jgi:hypothetical protein